MSRSLKGDLVYLLSHHQDSPLSSYGGLLLLLNYCTVFDQDNIREDMKEYNMTEVMAESRSLWHMKKKASPLLKHVSKLSQFCLILHYPDRQKFGRTTKFAELVTITTGCETSFIFLFSTDVKHCNEIAPSNSSCFPTSVKDSLWTHIRFYL